MHRVLVVDAANVVGATPDGWWKDRGGAAARLHERLLVADVVHDTIVLVLEGQAKSGVRPGKDAHVQTVHAPRDGDAAIVKAAKAAAEDGAEVTVVTADRALAARVAGVGAGVMSPSWLLDHL
ncbi:MAG: NYN domain-containing protein [Nocardioidaceae bacterium]